MRRGCDNGIAIGSVWRCTGFSRVGMVVLLVLGIL